MSECASVGSIPIHACMRDYGFGSRSANGISSLLNLCWWQRMFVTLSFASGEFRFEIGA